MTLLRWIVSLPLSVVIIYWLVTNRDVFAFNWSPVHSATDLSIQWTILGAIFIGFAWGAFIAWTFGAPVRRERRKLKRDVRDLESKLENTRKYTEEELNNFLPALPERQE